MEKEPPLPQTAFQITLSEAAALLEGILPMVVKLVVTMGLALRDQTIMIVLHMSHMTRATIDQPTIPIM